jgi:hypothetical protein
MRYLLLIQKSEAAWKALSDEGRAAWTKRYADYGKRMMEAGVARAGAILEPSETATTVRMRGGKKLVTDGPFAETSEQVAGVCVIDVGDIDEALRWAADHPDAEWGSVEVRPVRWPTS